MVESQPDPCRPAHRARPHRAISGAASALAVVLTASPLTAGQPSPAGGWTLTGGGSGHFGGGEMGDLAQTVATILYVLLSDDEEDWHDAHSHHDPYCDDELALSIPQAQYGLAFSYALTPAVALGGRLMYRHDHRRNDIARLWGGGPELVYTWGHEGDGARPYAGAGLLLTRGTQRGAAEVVAQGASVQARLGVHVRVGESVGYFVQTSLQHDRLAAHRIPVTGRTLGLGLGLALSVD